MLDQFIALRSAYQLADSRRRAMHFALCEKYGTFYSAPLSKRDRYDKLGAQCDKAAERFFKWLDHHSPRSWRSGIPYYWALHSLTYDDAITSGPLSVVPPPAWGCDHCDSQRFAQPVQPNTPKE